MKMETIKPINPLVLNFENNKINIFSLNRLKKLNSYNIIFSII